MNEIAVMLHNVKFNKNCVNNLDILDGKSANYTCTSNEKLFKKNRAIRTATKRAETSQ